jgi:hypothetical protein
MRKRLPLLRRPTITAAEWETICEESRAARELLSEPRFSFLRNYLSRAQASITDHFVRNRIKTVVERFKVGNITKSLTTTKAEQENELSGEYKFIDQMLSDLEATARQEEEYRQAAEAGKITIEGNSEKDG